MTKGGIRKFPEGRYAEIELTTDDRYATGSSSGPVGKGKVNMRMDSMDDQLEAAYEARPWRQSMFILTPI